MAVRQFTVRIATDVYKQVEARASVLGRSVNKEIENLLAWALDRQAEADEATFQKIREHLAGARKEPEAITIAIGLADGPV